MRRGDSVRFHAAARSALLAVVMLSACGGKVAASHAGADGGDGGTLSCNEIANRAATAFEKFAATREQCSVASDCTWVAQSCAFPCGHVISTASAAAADDELSKLCAPFEAQQCKTEPVPCPALHLKCDAVACGVGWP